MKTKALEHRASSSFYYFNRVVIASIFHNLHFTKGLPMLLLTCFL
jgi:hypothetical protein